MINNTEQLQKIIERIGPSKYTALYPATLYIRNTANPHTNLVIRLLAVVNESNPPHTVIVALVNEAGEFANIVWEGL